MCKWTAKFIPCRVKIWAAGNVASFVGKTLSVAVGPLGWSRVIVNDDLTIPGLWASVQVIGDLANFSHQTGEPLPGVSPVAMQQGRQAARNILRMICPAKSQSHFVISIREVWPRSDAIRPLRI